MNCFTVDENHLINSALIHYANICRKNYHPNTAKKVEQLAKKFPVQKIHAENNISKLKSEDLWGR